MEDISATGGRTTSSIRDNPVKETMIVLKKTSREILAL